jgi:predicted secreted protein
LLHRFGTGRQRCRTAERGDPRRQRQRRGRPRPALDHPEVQTVLKQALDAALAEARKAARPGQVEVQTGNFSLYPRYGNPGRGGAPAINGWQGTAELIVEGRDMPALAALAGRMPTLTIARVGYGLSREQREKVEAEVAAQAIARFRARAAEVARQFGFAGHAIREVAVSSGEPSHPPVPMMRAQAMSAAAEQAPLPVEAGKSTVTVTVSGSVQMK